MVLLIVGVVGCPAFSQHMGDVWVGVDTNGRLAISPMGYVPADNYKMLNPVNGLLKGWTDDDPGFDRLAADDPVNGVFRLEPGAEIWLEVVGIDPAFRIIDNGFQVLDAPGEDTFLGDHTLHVHNTWHIKNPDPAYDPEQCVWHATVILRDDGITGYASSEPLTFKFTSGIPVRDPAVPATGDFDGDADVDLDDYAAFEACLWGPGTLPQPNAPGITTCEVECLNAFDFDDDGDVDLIDFARFMEEVTK